MATNVLKTRIISKHDIEANWNLAVNFVPLDGEIILYTDIKQYKVGDGVTRVKDLPFYGSVIEVSGAPTVGNLWIKNSGESVSVYTKSEVDGLLALADSKVAMNSTENNENLAVVLAPTVDMVDGASVNAKYATVTVNPSKGSVNAAKFVGTLEGTAGQVANDLKVQVKTKDGTSTVTYNGSEEKIVEVDLSSVDVDALPAQPTYNGEYSLKISTTQTTGDTVSWTPTVLPTYRTSQQAQLWTNNSANQVNYNVTNFTMNSNNIYKIYVNGFKIPQSYYTLDFTNNRLVFNSDRAPELANQEVEIVETSVAASTSINASNYTSYMQWVRGSSAPQVTNAIWLDTSSSPNKVRVYNGSSWVAIV